MAIIHICDNCGSRCEGLEHNVSVTLDGVKVTGDFCQTCANKLKTLTSQFFKNCQPETLHTDKFGTEQIMHGNLG